MLQQNIENSYKRKLEILSGKKVDEINRKELIDLISGRIKARSSVIPSFLYSSPEQKVNSLEQHINETQSITFPEKIIKDEVCDSGFDQRPELYLMVKLCLNKTFLDTIDKINNQELLSYVAEVLIEIYNETKSNDILLKLHKTLEKCREESCDNLIEYLTNDSHPDILRVLYIFFKKEKENKSKLNLLEKCIKDSVFAKLSKDQIGNFQDINIDAVVFSKCTSLVDKIFLFYKFFDRNDLSNLLAISYVVDRKFYDHLEKIILNDDEFLPQKYSFNPYKGKTVTLQKAISNLLNVIIVDEVKKPGGVEYMQELIKKYDQYILNNPNFSHPIFYLVNSKMWKELDEWIKKEPEVLLAKDSNGKNLLISTILTFAHGHVKKQEHDALLRVQKFAIEKYIDSFSDREMFIKPSVGLFTSLSEYTNLADNEFTKTSRLYYKLLLEHFIDIDSTSGKNSFLDAEVLSGLTTTPFYRFILKSGFKIGHGDTTEVSDDSILLTKEQISKIFSTQMKLLNEIYDNLLDNEKNKINQNAKLVLDNLLEEAKRCVEIDNSLIARIIKDFINFKYSGEFSGKSEFQMQFYNAILEIIKLPSVNFQKFCAEEADTFNMICEMGEHDILKEFEKDKLEDSKEKFFLKRIYDLKNKINFFLGYKKEFYNADSNLVIENGVNAFWYANHEQSDQEAAKNFSEITLTLNKLLSESADVVQLGIKNINRGDSVFSYIEVIDTKNIAEKLSKKAIDHYDPIDYYNRSILTIAGLFLWHPGQVNLVQPSDYIVSSLKVLSHPNNRSNSLDSRQKMLHKAFEDLKNSNDNGDKETYEELDNVTSELWDDIRNLGYGRGKMLIEHLKQKKIINHGMPWLLTRFIKQSIMMNDVESAINWIKEDRSLLPYALEISVSVLNSKALSKMVDEFGLPETEKNLFGILYEHSKSQMMNDDPDFRRSVNEIAVKLLTSGYPIELIEEAASGLNYSEFIKDLVVTQMQYTATVKGIGFIRDVLPVNGIAQFGVNTVANLTTKFITANTAKNVYEKAFDFIYEKLSQDHKIDISQFCHTFSSTLQPQNFLSRLEKIPFISGLKKDFDKEKDREIILKNAQDTLPLIASEKYISLIENNKDIKDLRKKPKIEQETQRISDEISLFIKGQFHSKSVEMGIGKHNDFESLKQYLNSLPQDKEDHITPKQKDFLLHRFEILYKKHPTITSEKNINFKKLLATSSATAISGTFLYLNDPDFRNAVQGIVAILPTISGGISVANSLATNSLSVAAESLNDTSQAVIKLFKDNREIAYSALYLAMGGGVVYLSYKMYQEYIKNQENKLTDSINISIDIDTIRKLASKYKTAERDCIQNISNDEIYKFLTQLTKGNFVEQERFFKFCERFGVTTKMLSEAIEGFSEDGMFTIAQALSFNTMYLNAVEVKNAFDAINSQKKFDYKIEIVEFLHSVVKSQSTNMELEFQQHKIPQEFYDEISKLEITGNKPLLDHYRPEKHDMYLYVLQHADKISLTEEQHKRISADHFMLFILKLSDALKIPVPCQDVESDVVVRREYLSLM